MRNIIFLVSHGMKLEEALNLDEKYLKAFTIIVSEQQSGQKYNFSTGKYEEQPK